MHILGNLFLVFTHISSIISIQFPDNNFDNFNDNTVKNKKELSNQINAHLRNLTLTSLRCSNETQTGDYSYYTMLFRKYSQSGTAAEKEATKLQLFLPSVGSLIANETETEIIPGDKINLPFVMRYTQHGYGYYTFVKFNYVFENIISPGCYLNYYICNIGCDDCSTTNWCKSYETGAYHKEDDNTKCFQGEVKEYYLDGTMYKKCYSLCLTCAKPGDSLNNNCNKCKPRIVYCYKGRN